jgi:hypothetical protein
LMYSKRHTPAARQSTATYLSLQQNKVNTDDGLLPSSVTQSADNTELTAT